MNCPVCNVTLQMADRQGVEIDYCPKCRGIWLDRGELEKLIERSVTYQQGPPARGDRDSDYRDDDYSDRRGEEHHRGGKYKKRESWLGRILDFD